MPDQDVVRSDLCAEKHFGLNVQVKDLKKQIEGLEKWIKTVEKKYNAMLLLLISNLAGVIVLLYKG